MLSLTDSLTINRAAPEFTSSERLRRFSRAGASGPAGPVLAGPILREKVGVFISRQHVGMAATAIVMQRCTTLKQRSFLERNTWGTLILGQADVPAV